MATVTKQHIADALLEAGIQRLDEAMLLIDSTLELVKDTLASGEDVLVSGFGKFCIRDKKARKGRNPKTGEELVVTPRRVVTFHAANELRARCRALLHPSAGKGEDAP